jgi:hypothetical protein
MKSNLYLSYFCCLWLILGMSLTGCDVINPEETLPTTIHVHPFDFEVLPGQGSARNKISEIWVFANGSFLGAFNPPVDVQYLGEGPTTFTFRPGIRNNGIASDAISYPLFKAYTQQLDASPGATYEVKPVTGYLPETIFGFNSDFELDNPFTDNRDTVSASELIRSTSDVYEGQYSGEIMMSDVADFIEVSHVVPIPGLPADGSPVYLEFRYKSEIPMSIGLLGADLNGTSAFQFFYLVNPSAEWNMLYIELTEQIGFSAFDSYKILFRSLYPEDATAPAHYIFLDNIKVVYLPR